LAGLLVFALIKLFDTYFMMSVPIETDPTPDPLEAELSDTFLRYENGDIPVVDLSATTSFSWDRFYVFGPYTPLSSLESTVGRSWRKVCFTQIDVLEGYALLVFTKNNKVVHCLEYPTGTYDFSPLAAYSSGFSVQEALFKLDEKSGTVVWTEDK
jgi:hypothetical protein